MRITWGRLLELGRCILKSNVRLQRCTTKMLLGEEHESSLSSHRNKSLLALPKENFTLRSMPGPQESSGYLVLQLQTKLWIVCYMSVGSTISASPQHQEVPLLHFSDVQCMTSQVRSNPFGGSTTIRSSSSPCLSFSGVNTFGLIPSSSQNISFPSTRLYRCFLVISPVPQNTAPGGSGHPSVST